MSDSAIEEPWAWVLRLREIADRRPLVTDLVLAIVFDAVTSIQLIGGGENRWWVWLLQQLLVAPLVVRRRWPFPVFVVISGVAFGQYLAHVPLAADFALLIALFTVASHESRARTVASGFLLEIGAVLASQRFPPNHHYVYSVIFLSGLNVAAIFVGIAFRARRAYLDQLVENARQEQIQRANEVQLAASQERTRIAREMHDIVAHGLSVMTALADGAAVSMQQDPDQAETAMSTVSTVGRQSLREMRRLLGVLRDDTTPSSRAPQPGLDQLPELTEPLRLVGTSVDVQVNGEPHLLPPTEDATAYRIIQESLTNVVKHATGATTVSILIDWAPERLCLSIRDDGRAVTHGAPAAGHGLVGMAERTAMFDGELVAGPVPNGGWQVRATLPLSAVG